MVIVHLSEDVGSVRKKIGMETSEYLFAWRLLNTKAKEICHSHFGNVSLKQANILPAQIKLKEYYAADDAEDQITREKITEALQIDGAAGWIIHNALKRNNDKHRKAEAESSKAAAKTRKIFDPARDI